MAFSKLLLSHVKVKILLFLWHVFFGFLHAPPPSHQLTPSFLGKGKVLRWYISGASLMRM